MQTNRSFLVTPRARTVARLPAPHKRWRGAWRFKVNDATSTTAGSAVAGGGGNTVLVRWVNGVWRIG